MDRTIPTLPSKFRSAFAAHDDIFGVIASENYGNMKKSGVPYSSIFNVFRPVLAVVELDLIREILTAPLRDYFLDKGFHYSCDIVIPVQIPTQLDGRNWEDMCEKLVPNVASKHLKGMLASVTKASDVMLEALFKYAVEDKDIDVKEFLACFTSDLIGLQCFNIQCCSYEHYYVGSHEWPIIGGLARNLKYSATYNYPDLSRILGVTATDADLSTFVYHRIKDALELKEKCRDDTYFTDLMLYLYKRRELIPDPPDMCHMIGQETLFFRKSFDIICSTLYFAIYELCRNVYVQDKLRAEIQDILEKYGEVISGDSLNEMKYLQQVIYETMRMYPPVANYLRLCVKDYKLKEGLTIKQRTKVFVPLFAIHRDPQYCPEPDMFYPERFSRENKDIEHPYIFMPYGEGLKDGTSIHASFLQCQIGLIRILSKFRLHISPKTILPLQPDPQIFMKSKERLYVRLEKIK